MKTTCIIVILLSLFGCAPNRKAIMNNMYNRVDPISVENLEKYRNDIDECTQYAMRVQAEYQNEVMKRAFVGALAGAVTGAAMGKMYNLPKNSVGRIAGSAATYGAAAGAVSTPNNVETTTINCLLNRGYSLLY